MIKRTLALLLGLLLAGCATTNIVMKNPRTEQILVCQRV